MDRLAQGLVVYSLSAKEDSRNIRFEVMLKQAFLLLLRTGVHPHLSDSRAHKVRRSNIYFVLFGVVCVVYGVIFVIVDNGVEVSGYERKELLGKSHRVLNSGHHPK